MLPSVPVRLAGHQDGRHLTLLPIPECKQHCLHQPACRHHSNGKGNYYGEDQNESCYQRVQVRPTLTAFVIATLRVLPASLAASTRLITLPALTLASVDR